MDDAISPDMGSDSTDNDTELPVDIKSVSIDGTDPEVGDHVDVKVGGTITRVVNGVGYLKPETINDSPMPASPIETDPNLDETDRLRQMSQTADAGATY